MINHLPAAFALFAFTASTLRGCHWPRRCSSRAQTISEIDGQTLILADVGRKALEQVYATVVEILTGNGMAKEKAEELATTLARGRWTHDYPISSEEVKALGLPVSNDIPNEVHELMSFYPQALSRRPSVQSSRFLTSRPGPT